MLARVRNRQGLISASEPFDGSEEGRFHLVTVEYLDGETPQEDQLIWEREVGTSLREPTALPNVSGDPAMPPDDFDAVVRAARWTALSPYICVDEWQSAPLLPITAPFHSAVQIEDFQLVPLLKALRMPRVALLLADDVGLGKTIEAGLILRELLTRRRVRRVLVLCPASLRLQWRQEMQDKFSLPFDVVDRASTHALQKHLGMDANPWRVFSRIISSYDYLKQPDVLEQFRSACRVPEGSPHLPWDLLIVDEAHNLSPAPFGEESDLTRMLRILAPHFEHKLFLTATPHNGYTRSFTGLLECLDPVRFTQKSEPLTESDKRRVEQVVVRRLKSEINARTQPPRFCERRLISLPLHLSPEERDLSRAFDMFRSKIRSLMASDRRAEQVAGSFAVEVLGKRLLSCPVAFADSWRRYSIGLRETQSADLGEVQAARRSLHEETGDDREAEARGAHAARTVGAWLKPFADRLDAEKSAIDSVLRSLGLDITDDSGGELTPRNDARFDALFKLIEDALLGHPGERLVVFTEYKTTLDYLERRLGSLYAEDGFVRVLFGGMGDEEREDIKSAFNDPADPVRILIATDAAAEGLNLQETARYILHYDVPWNPARLEQRNGRLDRHGQARDVVVYHFATDDDADLAFLSYVIGKVHTIREDLGSMGQVFDCAIERRLVAGDDADVVRMELEKQLDQVKGRAEIPKEENDQAGAISLAHLRFLADEADLDPDSLRETVDVALGLRGAGRPRLDGPDERGRFRLRAPIPAQWNALIDDSLRIDQRWPLGRRKPKGALPAILFDASKLVRDIGGRRVFRADRDSVLLHLDHPLVRRALSALAQTRFPGTRRESGEQATRWTVRQSGLPADIDALVLLTVEELAVNELRETFHHWVRTLQIPVSDGRIGEMPPHVPAKALRAGLVVVSAEDVDCARSIWEDIAVDIRDLVGQLSSQLTEILSSALDADRKTAIEFENERFLSRQGEISALIENTTIRNIEREIEKLRADRIQGALFDSDQRLEGIDRSIEEKEREIGRRRAHYEELRAQLQRERDRMIRYIIPKRHTLRGKASVFPVAIEIRLPEYGR